MISIDAYAKGRHAFYYPSIALVYMKKGTLLFEVDGQEKRINSGEFLLMDRFVHGYMEKFWTKEEGYAQLYGFALRKNLVEKLLKRIKIPTNQGHDSKKPYYILQANPILSGFFESVAYYLEENQDLDAQLLELKTLEALIGIISYNEECYSMFTQEDPSAKVNLAQLMENNFMLNLPLQKFAELSEMSLSTFYREFKSIFNDAPHRWIKKRRLQAAKELLINTNRKPADFYLELGFESLAHFSRSFKKEFGLTMTDFKKNNVINMG